MNPWVLHAFGTAPQVTYPLGDYAAKTLGCHAIRVNAHSKGTYDETMKLVADGLRQVVEYGAGQQISVIVVFTNLSGGHLTANLTIQILNSSGAVVASTTDANEDVAGGQTDSDTLDWTPSATGVYTVRGVVTNSAGTVLSQKNLGTVTVN